ncbi:MAG: PIN domain-containing protein [Geobacteraceae bacterium]|nr:PIN domain-containing protein [Geobacteraceae bacterium]
MRDRVFIDTNVLVYAALADSTHADKRSSAIALLGNESDFVVSTQVVNEFYVVVLKHGFCDKEIQKRLDELFAATDVAVISEETIRRAWRLRSHHHFSYWDSLIVATALENSCKRLYTEDMQHGQVIERKLTIINPFL